MEYSFDPAFAAGVIKDSIREFAGKTGGKMVLGISGGKDSTICGKLAAEALGFENVYGVLMPNGQQGDLCDALEAVRLAGIRSFEINIKSAFDALVSQLECNRLKPSADTIVNMPPRLRMTTLYAVAQTVGGTVICTDNLDERLAGYFTLYGDGAGSFAPLRDLTVGEVLAVGKEIGLPERLVCKKPGDGLQPLGDEDRLGFTYAEMDAFIRMNEGDEGLKARILDRYRKNKFKTDIVDIPGPKFDYPNFVAELG